MNPIAEEIRSYYGSGNDENFLEHYGMPRRSGRYPWGSGDNPYQRSIDFLGRIEELKKNGWTETPENIKTSLALLLLSIVHRKVSQRMSEENTGLPLLSL